MHRILIIISYKENNKIYNTKYNKIYNTIIIYFIIPL